jgi:transcriptional regulator with XRE-family HTH domain
MDAAHLLRAARRAAAVSQRGLAARAGVAPSVVGEIESGRSQPQVATLERLLHALGLELGVLPRYESEDEALRRWLRASTSDRLRWALGPAVTRALTELGRGPFVLPPVVSAGVWLPGRPVPSPLPVLVPLFVGTGPAHPLLRPARGPWAVHGLVAVGFGPFHTALVWPPEAPVMQEVERAPELRAVARLLHA